LIVPSRKQKKKQAEFIQNLKRGDEVMTSGGILGRVEGITDVVLTLEIADQTRIKILKSQVVQNPLKEKQ
jgi:preprotein translocase subunit YajC